MNPQRLQAQILTILPMVLPKMELRLSYLSRGSSTSNFLETLFLQTDL